MQLLTSLLESNPFAAKLETEDLVKKLEEEEKKLAALCPEEVTIDQHQHQHIIIESPGEGPC